MGEKRNGSGCAITNRNSLQERAVNPSVRHIVLLLMGNNLFAVAFGCIAGAAGAMLVPAAIQHWFGMARVALNHPESW